MEKDCFCGAVACGKSISISFFGQGVGSHLMNVISKVCGDQHHYAEERCTLAYRVTWYPVSGVSVEVGLSQLGVLLPTELESLKQTCPGLLSEMVNKHASD